MTLLGRLRSFWSSFWSMAGDLDYDRVEDLSDRIRQLELRLDELTRRPPDPSGQAEPGQRWRQIDADRPGQTS